MVIQVVVMVTSLFVYCVSGNKTTKQKYLMKQNIIRNMTTLCSKQFSGDETSFRAFDSLNDCGSDQY